MTQDLKERIKFFVENAGYCTPPGRMTCAKHLAEAESLAAEIGLTVKWGAEDCPDTSWMSAKDLKQFEDDYIQCLVAYISDDAGHCLASLGNIFVKDTSDPYCRVIEAELFQEAIETLKKGER